MCAHSIAHPLNTRRLVMFPTHTDKTRRLTRRFELAVSWLALGLAGGPLMLASAAQAQEPARAAQAVAADQRQASAEDSRMIETTLPAPGQCVAPPPDMDAWYPF